MAAALVVVALAGAWIALRRTPGARAVPEARPGPDRLLQQALAAATADQGDAGASLVAGLLTKRLEAAGPAATVAGESRVLLLQAIQGAEAALARDPAAAAPHLTAALAHLAADDPRSAIARIDAMPRELLRGRARDVAEVLRAVAATQVAGPAVAARRLREACAEQPSALLAAALDATLRGARAQGQGAFDGDRLTHLAQVGRALADPRRSREARDLLGRMAEPSAMRAGPEPPFLLGHLHLARGELGDAAASFRAALEAAPDDARLVHAAAVAYVLAGHEAEALAICRRASCRDETGWSHFLAGVLAARSGSHDDAAASFRAALERDPLLWPARVHLAATLARSRDVPGAVAVVDAGLTLTPRSVALQLARADVLANSGAAAEAEEAIDAALRDEPSSAPALVLAGRSRLARGDSAGAVAAFERAIDAAPELIPARVEWVRAHAAQGRLDAATARLRHEVEERSRSAAAWFALACVEELRGDVESACARYRRALAIEPRAGAAANNFAWLLATRLGRFAEAVPWAERARALLPESAQVADTHGWVLFLAGRVEEAERELARAVDLAPDAPRTIVRHARVLRALGRWSEASAACARAEAADPRLRADRDFLELESVVRWRNDR